MFPSIKSFQKHALGIPFIAIVILIQVIPSLLAVLLGIFILLLFLNKSFRTHNIYITCMMYINGFWISDYLSSVVLDSALSTEWRVILSRMSLIGFILPFFIMNKLNRTEINYLSVGSFRNTIYFPFIWKGLFKDPIWRFLIISSSIIIISFSFVIDFNQPDLILLLMCAVMFSVVNSILEEILWRGYILSRIVSHFGEKYGLIITSVGFGFYHYSLGIPWLVCALFSIFGMIMGGVAIRAQGLLPTIMMHFLMNIMFVLIGIIF
ncbi:CPBP family intramembrane glutamic endopeptidase [Paenibacillus beijingensis]|uniref:CAAX prenyl protease 2/Lysostaphin resistance protein A-like domain-containing protein n=1 Tax=Paenibacillus beijingensis TaxID=1126833 RepID=A0A0D5NP46_9BACL|nr:type II CAAX endopeptidase family protein [Paenibacillus beijingensis]AJY76935.1 hypothetical protein VN24_23195 [Paenibacillus beijingensis]